MASIKPFRFQLAQVSKEEEEVVAGLLDYLPSTGLRDSFHLAIRKALQKYLSDVRYFVERIETEKFHNFFVGLPNPCCVAVLGLEPFQEKAFIEIDPMMSFLIIEKLLGGKGEGIEELSPLTETEQGVIEFLLLKLLSEIHKLSGEKSRIHFRLEKMVLEPSQLRDFEKQKPEWVVLKIHVTLLGRSGFINIYLPHPWILEGFLKEMPKDRRLIDHAERKSRLSCYQDFPIDLWGMLGRATVSYLDFKGLEEGDVILFDETGLERKKGEWQGRVTLWTGKGESAGLEADWEGFQENGTLRVTGSVSGGK